MRISADLALPIIEKLKNDVNFDINIMNDKGVIVASTDSNRLQQVHEGAFHVINNQSPLVIYPKERGKYSGSREGVNLPIEFLGEIIGVVGVTGHPDELSQFVHVIKVTVEVLVQQVHFNNQLHYQKTLMENWVLDLVHPHYFDEKRTDAYARHYLNINSSEQVQILVVSFNKPTMERKGVYERQAIQEDIYKRIKSLIPSVLFHAFFEDSYCVIGIQCKEILPVAEHILKDLDKNYKDLKIGIGEKYHGVKGYRKSFFEAMDSIGIMDKFQCTKRIAHIHEWGIIRLVKQIPEEKRQVFLDHYYFDLNDELIETLHVLFECQINMKETASKLHIHRNTLIYRLESIQNQIGLDPRKFDDAMTLRIILIIKQL
ncbi:CdaR family transcriptional regulator [Aquibacillus albus]|uniref:Carbohydrate diacid regulator n=1 Tax=Aquibacillus albus TaxID=1168171 RepID=A0ABS2N0L7_9BACI|nr:sugar diacid recognition domain-containing protein [Aquibacillus albus]MBM7571660.1 carbohydrate diacid regulator [Aquibacillus albus]